MHCLINYVYIYITLIILIINIFFLKHFHMLPCCVYMLNDQFIHVEFQPLFLAINLNHWIKIYIAVLNVTLAMRRAHPAIRSLWANDRCGFAKLTPRRRRRATSHWLFYHVWIWYFINMNNCDNNCNKFHN